MTIQEWMIKINGWADRKGWNGIKFCANCHRTMEENAACIGHMLGFYVEGGPDIRDELLNFHCEISEAQEELRKGYSLTEFYYRDPPNNLGSTINDNNCGYHYNIAESGNKPEGFPIEIADLAIRLLHTCAFHGIDLEKYMEIKMTYNETRPFRHGGKKA